MSDNRPTHTGLEGRIADIIVEPLEAQGYELVRVQVIGTETPTVQIMADRADGASFTLEDCEKISRLLSAVLDVEDPIQTRLDAGSFLRRHRPAADPHQGFQPLCRV